MRRKTSSVLPGHATSNSEVSMTEATKRINEIIGDADRQAGRIIVNAEVEARQYLASVKQRTDQDAAEYARAMAALSEALISQAEALSRESQRLLATVGRAEEGPEDLLVAAAPKPQDEVPVETLPELDDPTQEFSAGSRLLATQMAVAGSTRSDIHDRLVNDFGIVDPKPLLDSILGPG